MNNVVLHIGNNYMVNIFGDITGYGESCIMVYEFWSSFGMLWSGGMDSGMSS